MRRLAGQSFRSLGPRQGFGKRLFADPDDATAQPLPRQGKDELPDLE
jgi:hypothetical protein